MIEIAANEATAAKRRVEFDLRDSADFTTPELDEEGGQPQISVNDGAWTNTGIGTLVPVGGAGQGASCAGRYYATLTEAAVATAGDVIRTRYKSANTPETPGDTIRVVAYDPASAQRDLVDSPNATAVSVIQTGMATANAVSAITAILAGITSLPKWLRALARKDAPDATALSEINSGGGEYSAATDSQEAIKDSISAANDPWDPVANPVRTLSQTASQVAAAVSGSTLTILAWDTWSASLTGLSIPAHTKMWLVVKAQKEDTDAQALIFIEKTDGLTVVNGAAYSTPTDGALTVGATSVTMALKGAASGLLPNLDRAVYALKVLRTSDGEPQTLASGRCDVDWGVARVVS